MNFVEKVKGFFRKTYVKAMTAVISACMAVSCVAISAFADDPQATDVIDTVTTSMTEQLTSLVSKAGVAIAAVVGVGLVIFGVKWLVGVLKSFFRKLAS